MKRAPSRGGPATRDSRGQAYIAEALFAVVLLAGIMFIATTTLVIQEPQLSADDREQQAEIEADLQGVLEQSKRDGSLKSSVLNYSETDEEYVDSNNEEGVYYYLPRDQFGDQLFELALRHNASINVKLTPARNASADSSTFNRTRPESVPYISPDNAANTMITMDTHITLYGSDRLQSPPRAHRTGQTPSNTTAGEERLSETDSFMIPPATESVDDDEIYNVVNVRVIVWF